MENCIHQKKPIELTLHYDDLSSHVWSIKGLRQKIGEKKALALIDAFVSFIYFMLWNSNFLRFRHSEGCSKAWKIKEPKPVMVPQRVPTFYRQMSLVSLQKISQLCSWRQARWFLLKQVRWYSRFFMLLILIFVRRIIKNPLLRPLVRHYV